MSVDVNMMVGRVYNPDGYEMALDVRDHDSFVTVNIDGLSVYMNKDSDGEEIARKLAFAFNTAAEMCHKTLCSLCGEPVDGMGHNPEPLADYDERCCSVCNDTKVIPERIKRMAKATS